MHIPLMAAKFDITTYKLCEYSSHYVWFFLIYTERGTELAIWSVTTETNKTVKHFPGHRNTMWMVNFCNSLEMPQFRKSKRQTVLELQVLIGKVFLSRKNKKYKTGVQCGQHSGDVAVLVWQGKK
jgi:hypothetical protein